MSRRADAGVQNTQVDHVDAEDETAATAAAIAGLRRRLRCQNMLEHPAVRRELGELESQLIAQLERAERTVGRHRFPPGGAPGRNELIGSQT